MKRKRFIVTLLTLTALFGAGLTIAGSGMTTAYVVHGIDGDDFALDPNLPVDVFVSGLGCAIPNFRFGDRVGPLSVPAGSYDITISLADATPCAGTDVISVAGVSLEEDANATIIAHRTFDGMTGAGDLLGLGVTASVFSNDFNTAGRGKARVLVQHTAFAPSVDVVVSRNYADPNAPGVTVPGFTNPSADGDALLSQINAEFRPGRWDVALELGGATVFGPDRLRLRPGSVTSIFAVGDFGLGTFQYLIFTDKSSNSGGPGAGLFRGRTR